MRGTSKKGPGQARRQASERALVDAFEALLQRQGPSGLGVNAVLGSAGVGKRLLQLTLQAVREDDDHHTFTMYMGQGKGWLRVMEIRYTRKK